ncbi:hypothetical protein BGZ51_008628 [Haplosporangium sp. Z 767]|nr:hypothetical protein BGZ51_008628 [Haplosporangium sp. Z 767]
MNTSSLSSKKAKTLDSNGGYAKAIPDITAALERGRLEDLPLFLVGHSYVSLIINLLASTLASATSTEWKLGVNYDCIEPLRTQLTGVIMSALLILASAPTHPNRLTVVLAGAMSKVLPSFQIPLKLSSFFVSPDVQQAAKYDTVPLIHGYGTAIGMYVMLTNAKLLFTNRYQKIAADMSLLIYHGTVDDLTDYEASKGSFDKCNAKDKEFKS